MSPAKKKMPSTIKGTGTPGGWRNRRIKKESGKKNDGSKKGRYFHIMPDIGSEEEDEGEEDKTEEEGKALCSPHSLIRGRWIVIVERSPGVMVVMSPRH